MADNEGRDFCWIDSADKIIVPDQAAIACYLNGYGDIVLRRRSDYPAADGWIWFQAEHAVAIAAAILAAAGLGAKALAPEPVQDGSKKKDSTAAERQRRYRERQKEESTPDTFDRNDRDAVTERHGVTA